MSITPFFHVYHKYVFIMANISKIKISGTSYNLKDENACKVVELTQAQYDELPTTAKTSNSLFVITDATAGDLSNYYTKSETSGATEISTALESKADTATTYTKTETDNAITAATSTKQDTLVSGTNIKTINGETLLGEGNITIEGGGSSYTAGDGIDINNDVISVTGKVDTSTYNTYTAATDTALASKQTTLTAGTGISIVDNVISATGGGVGGESCTVDSTAIFYTFSGRYSNDALDMMARYAVLDYAQDKTETPDTSIEVYFRDIDYIQYVNQTIQLNYSTSSYTLGDISQAEYIDVTYDSTIDDFKIAVATAYTSTVFIDNINFLNGNIKVPFYTISSGSPCTAIENDIPTAISELGNNMLKGLKEISIGSRQDAISIYTDTIGGNNNSRKIKLDEIDGSNSTLKPDIYVGLGTSGWTEINLSDQCSILSLKSTKYRVTYNNNSELYAYFMGLQFIVEYAGNEVNNQVNFDETKHPSLQTTDLFSAATVDWNDSTRELVITYPETIELDGKQESVKISQIYSNGCNFGQAITKFESYGEVKQALKPYVKETRAALSGKVDTSAITTLISSSSTDSQVPSAKAVYDMVGNINTILESI